MFYFEGVVVIRSGNANADMSEFAYIKSKTMGKGTKGI
jgi:hypothetical protein